MYVEPTITAVEKWPYGLNHIFAALIFRFIRNTSILAINGHPSKYRNVFSFLIILHPSNQQLLTKGNENRRAEGAVAQRMTVIRDREKID